MSIDWSETDLPRGARGREVEPQSPANKQPIGVYQALSWDAMLVVVLVGGHIVVAIASRPEGRDERDRLIEWRSESNSSWILGVGVLAAIVGLVASVDNVWIAHLLLLTMLLSEVARFIFQLIYYRWGM